MKSKILGLLAVALLAGPMAARAVTLDFEGVLTSNPTGVYANATVDEFYNGGVSGAANSTTGPDYNVRFVSGSLAIRSSVAGGTASFIPSATGPGSLIGSNALALADASLRIDFLEAITGQFSLTYSSPFAGSVELLSDSLDAQGERVSVGAFVLPKLEGYGSEFFDVWARQTITLTGGATSLFVRGVSQALVIDNITFNREPASVPEPGTLALLGLGLLGLGMSRRKA